jgi:hypothetical protein
VRPRTPPLFGDATPRLCTRWLSDRNCGAPAVRHVAWTQDAEGIDAGFVCEEHLRELGVLWSYIGIHDVAPDCGMPGARWYDDACRCPDDLVDARPLERERELVGG